MSINKPLKLFSVFLFFVFFTTSCNSKISKQIVDDTADSSYVTIPLFDNLKLIGIPSDALGYSTLNPIKIVSSGDTVFIDSTNEYIIESTGIFPFKRKLGPDSYEILLLIDARPNSEQSVYLKFNGGHLISRSYMPAFTESPVNLDKDTMPELSGYLNDGESFSNDPDSVLYNPVLFYELSHDGMRLDTVTTIEENRKLYGDFFGYYYNEQLQLKIRHAAKL